MSVKISDLPSASLVSGSEIIEIEQGGVSKKTTVSAIAGGGVPESGFTQLVNGQDYIDVLFSTPQVNNQWFMTGGFITNTSDASPLNISHGVITHRTTLGFRLQLIGIPDSNNYKIGWVIVGSPANTGSEADTYSISGPSSGHKDTASTNFTVSLPVGSTVPSSVTITPDDGAAAGSFSPATVNLTTAAPSATFTYTPTTYGARTISVTNNGGLDDPLSVNYVSTASAYTFSGPSSGTVGIESTNFTVELPVGGAVLGTVTITPADGGDGGTFTPSTVGLTTTEPSATFTYTPASYGDKTLVVSNNGGMTNPSNIVYAASVSPTLVSGMTAWWVTPAGSDGDAVGIVFDSSGVGNNLFGGDSTLKNNIINGLPVLRFDGINDGFIVNSPMVSQPGTIFVVAKPGASITYFIINETATQMTVDASGFFEINGGVTLTDAIDHRGAFHVFTAKFNGASSAIYVDGVQTASGNAGTGGWSGPTSLMNNTSLLGSTYSTGDIAEIIAYNTALSNTDRELVEFYLKTKYATP